jgi:hypothetical protein
MSSLSTPPLIGFVYIDLNVKNDSTLKRLVPGQGGRGSRDGNVPEQRLRRHGG